MSAARRTIAASRVPGGPPRLIVLAGFMGAGKSTAGRLLAGRLGYRFLDMDEILERRLGRTIAETFRVEGEPAFRRHERALALELAGERDAVVAAGGGALLRADVLRRFQSAGEVVCLTARPETLLRRVAAGDRPLLAGGPASAGPAGGAAPRERIASLLAERDAAYRRIPLHVATDGRTPAEVARAVAALFPLHRLHVDAGERRYPIEVAPGLLDRLAPRLAPHLARDAVIVTDTRVRRLYAGRVEAALRELGVRSRVLAVAPGESSKTLAAAGRLYEAMLRFGADRQTTVIALGGGVPGDLAGFIAGTLKRGLPLVQLPTTLVAQLDSAIGGKNGVNLDGAKNQVGTVHAPLAVLADPAALATLSARDLRDGLAEAVKTAVIGSPRLFDLIEDRLEDLLGRDIAALDAVVREAAAVKARIVSRDPHERGERHLLNFGHTVGHALEAAARGALTHGQAVSVGMVLELRLAWTRGGLNHAAERRVSGLLARAGLPVTAPRLPARAVREALRHDKKARGAEVVMPLPRRIGRADIETVPQEEVLDLLGL